MSAVDARLLLLGAEIDRDWAEVVRHLDRAESADPLSHEHAAAFVALAIDHAYQAFETLLVRIERALALPARAGGTWHRALLEDAALDVPGLRPALIAAESVDDWATVMAFRHFLRHAYASPLDPRRLEEPRRALRRAVTSTGPRVAGFVASLRA